MKYLSLDIEATGLGENDRIIEFAAVPFCTETKKVEQSLALATTVQCPSFEDLRPTLSPWVIEHNKELIEKAHREGVSLEKFKTLFRDYLESSDVLNYFALGEKEKIVLFGKSLNAIDLPFLNRDLGWDYMREKFHYQVLDLSSVARFCVDMGLLPGECINGEALMANFNMGRVSHTALGDAVNGALLYLHILEAQN